MRIILKQDVKVQTDFIRLRRGFSDGIVSLVLNLQAL
jgi:hypothetical protein